MKIQIFPSGSGDCLLVTSRDGRRLLADAGMPDAYDAFISKPLSRLRDAGEKIDVAYVSHVDRDHIGGVLKLLDDEVKWRAFEHSQSRGGRMRQPKVPRPPAVEQIWHNAFLEDIERTEAVDIGAALASSADILSGLNAAMLDPAAASIADAARMLSLSVGDAIEVNWRIGADQLDIPLNPDFGGELMTARPDVPISVGSLTVRVLGPTATELRKFRRNWIEWLRKSQVQIDRLKRRHQRDADAIGTAVSPRALAELSREFALAAVETDVTPPNLASLVLLVEEEDGRRLLLTGDAGDESLLRYLAASNMLDADGGMEVDVLKVPHHGAHNSYSEPFVRQVRAQHYIFCGDGEHHNPEPEVVAGYIKAVRAAPLSGGRKATFWFNWSSDRATNFKDHWDKIEALFKRQGVAEVIKRRSLRKSETSMILELT
jgi:beta-lactamase superfamily II metal-dependent hydrolase